MEERSSFKMPEPVKKAGKCAHSPTIEHFVITFHTGAVGCVVFTVRCLKTQTF